MICNDSVQFEPVRERRLQVGKSVVTVAQAAGKSLSWAQQVERGLIIPSRKDAESIAAFLDSSPEALFSRVRDEPAG